MFALEPVNADNVGMGRLKHSDARVEPGHHQNCCRLCPAYRLGLAASLGLPPWQPRWPPLQEPPPLFPARWPVPVAVLSPALTLTTTAPFLPTLPEMLTVAVPALPKVPLVMRDRKSTR